MFIQNLNKIVSKPNVMPGKILYCTTGSIPIFLNWVNWLTYIVELNFSAAFDRVSHSALLFKLESIDAGAVYCPFVKNSSPNVGRESWLMVLRAYELVDPNHFFHATAKCVGSSSVYPTKQRNVWAGWEQTICLCLCMWLYMALG